MNDLSDLQDSFGYTLIGGGQQNTPPLSHKCQGQLDDYNICAIETEAEEDEDDGEKRKIDKKDGKEEERKENEAVLKSPKPRDSGCYTSLGEISPK